MIDLKIRTIVLFTPFIELRVNGEEVVSNVYSDLKLRTGKDFFQHLLEAQEKLNDVLGDKYELDLITSSAGEFPSFVIKEKSGIFSSKVVVQIDFHPETLWSVECKEPNCCELAEKVKTTLLSHISAKN